MKFGVNKNMTYVGNHKKDKPKKLHNPDAPTEHLDTLDDNADPNPIDVKSDDPKTTDVKADDPDPSTTDTETPILVASVLAIATLVILKYIVKY